MDEDDVRELRKKFDDMRDIVTGVVEREKLRIKQCENHEKTLEKVTQLLDKYETIRAFLIFLIVMGGVVLGAIYHYIGLLKIGGH